MSSTVSKMVRAAACILAILLSDAAHAEVAVEGDHTAVTVTASDAQRGDVIAEIVRRFDLTVEGASAATGAITGRFSGSLSQVLKSVLEDEGYAIAYRDGRPTRITFARHGTTATANQSGGTTERTGSEEEQTQSPPSDASETLETGREPITETAPPVQSAPPVESPPVPAPGDDAAPAPMPGVTGPGAPSEEGQPPLAPGGTVEPAPAPTPTESAPSAPAGYVPPLQPEG